MPTDLLTTIAWCMKRLPFVMWDRYTIDVARITAFGWISRSKDTYKDFVVIEFQRRSGLLSFVTSSAERSKDISVAIFGDAIGHEECRRVEIGFQGFNIPNVIRLKTQEL